MIISATGIWIAGANGAGKTTLMRMLCAILESTSGEVYFNGEEVTGMGSEYRNILGYLPQDFGYYSNYTASEFLRYIAVLKGIPGNIARERIREILDIVDLSHVAPKKVKTFSGGMKQRIGIADEVLMMKDGRFILQGTVLQLVQKADGKVWELSVSKEEARKWEAKTIMANFRHEGGQCVLRIISETKPAEQAVSCEAMLEDLYLYYFGTMEGEN